MEKNNKKSTELLLIEIDRKKVQLNELLRDVDEFGEQIKELGLENKDHKKSLMRINDPREAQLFEISILKKSLNRKLERIIDISSHQFRRIEKFGNTIPDEVYEEARSVLNKFDSFQKEIENLLGKGTKSVAKIKGSYFSRFEPYSFHNQNIEISHKVIELSKIYEKYYELWEDAKEVSDKEKYYEKMIVILDQIEETKNLERDNEIEYRNKQFGNSKEKARTFRLWISICFSIIILISGLWLVLSGKTSFWDIGGIFIGYGLIGLGIDLNHLKKVDSWFKKDEDQNENKKG